LKTGDEDNVRKPRLAFFLGLSSFLAMVFAGETAGAPAPGKV
jgi:hypothetical protein